jgi:hypothetical protein
MTSGPAGGPPQNQPEDPLAYRIAVGAVGIALCVFFLGAAIIAANGEPVPTQYWTSGSAIAGALLGILAPTPTKSTVTQKSSRTRTILSHIAGAIVDLWSNRALLILIVVFGVSTAFAIAHNSAPLEAVAGASGGALVGLLAPPPASGRTGVQ